ncbi:beta-lactamase [Algibacter lectus]|nr:beta-lactamase [Algibacter lectus]
MYAALGKNDQKIYIVPSKKLVIIRMGNAADSENFALSSFDNDLWAKINALIE